MKTENRGFVGCYSVDDFVDEFLGRGTLLGFFWGVYEVVVELDGAENGED